MFDWLKKQFKRDKKEGVQTMADLFSGDIKDVPKQVIPQKVQDYFAPVTTKGKEYKLKDDFRTRDFARELPGAVGNVAKEIAQGTARSFDWAGRQIAPKILPGWKDNRKDGEWTNMEQFMFGDTGKKLSESPGELRDVAEAEWGLSRDSMFAPLVGGITVGLDLLPGGKGTKSMFKAAIKETDPRIIKGWLKAARPEAPDDAIENLAKIVAKSKDEKDIADILTTAGFKDVPLSKPRANKPIKGDDGKFAGSEKAQGVDNERPPVESTPGSPTLFRLANANNKTTDATRGGTWYTNESGAELVSESGDVIGGSNRYSIPQEPRNPLVIDNATLEDGSFAVINSGYENFIPSKYSQIAYDLYTTLYDDGVDIELNIMNALYDAGIPEATARTVLNESKSNKFDAAMDLIVSKGLREAGYDGLVLKSGDAEHVMTLAKPTRTPEQPKFEGLTTKTLAGSEAGKVTAQTYYHGTPRSVSDLENNGFDVSRSGTNEGHIFGKGVYLTNKEDRAGLYGNVARVDVDPGAKLLELRGGDEVIDRLFSKATDYGEPQKITDAVLGEGYDGLRIIGPNGDEEVVVMRPEKLRIITNKAHAIDSKFKTKDDALLQEAKKYKTADEFVRSEGKVLYHSSEDIMKDGKPNFDAYFGDEDWVKAFRGEFGKNEYQVVLPDGYEILDLNKDTPQSKRFFDKFGGKGDDFYGEVWVDKYKILPELKKAGYVGARFNEEYILTKNAIDSLKTRSQLTDIYNQAHGKGATTRGTPDELPLTLRVALATENSAIQDPSTMRESAYEYLRANPDVVRNKPIELREADGKLSIQDGRHRLQVAHEMGITPKFVDVSAEFGEQPSKRIADLIGEEVIPAKQNVYEAHDILSEIPKYSSVESFVEAFNRYPGGLNMGNDRKPHAIVNIKHLIPGEWDDWKEVSKMKDSKERIQKYVNNFDINKLDPVLVHIDARTGDMSVEDGHHRMATLVELAMTDEIPVFFDRGSLERLYNAFKKDAKGEPISKGEFNTLQEIKDYTHTKARPVTEDNAMEVAENLATDPFKRTVSGLDDTYDKVLNGIKKQQITLETNGAALAVAPITGIETDDEGHVTGFDPIKAGLGFAVVAGVSNARGTQAYQEAVQKGKTIISPRRQRTINNYGLNEDSVATILDAQRRGVIPHKETVNLAAKKTATIDKLITLQKGTITTGEQAEAYKQTVAGYKGHVRKLRENHLANPTDILLKKQYDDGMATLTRAYANLEAIYSEAGRVVESSKIVPITRFDTVNANIQKVRSDLPPEAQVKFDMDLENLDLDNPTEVMNFLTNAQKQSWMRKITEYYRASLLSGVTTQVINATGNLLSTIADVPIRATAATISKGRTALTGKPRDVYMGEAWQLMSEGVRSVDEAAIHAFRAIKDEHYAMQYDRARVESGTAIPQIKGVKGKVVRIPFRFLSAMDLFFRTVKTNSEASALMYRKARSEGLDGVELMARMEELKRQMPTEITEQVTERAERALYLEDLGGWLKKIESVKNEHPWMQMLIPFYRTLLNLMREAYRMTPARFLSKDKWIKGADTKTEEQARAMLGTIAGLYLTNAVMDGRLEVTGAAPSDKKERDTFYGVGKQPYSIRVGDKWIPYQRVQPFSTILFLASKTADIWNFHKETGEMNPDDAADAAGLLISEIGQFFVDQAPMQGIATFMESINGGKYNQGTLPAAGDFFAQMLGGFVPNIIYSGVRAVDPTIYETEGIVENIQKRVPGQQGNLVPSRGAMGDTSKRDGSPLGRFLNPFVASENTNDPIYNELERLGTGIGFPQKKAFQQDLTAEEYDVLLRDAGARTRLELGRIMSTDSYKNARDDIKLQIIEDIIRNVRKESVGTLFPHRLRQLQAEQEMKNAGGTDRMVSDYGKEKLGLSDKEASSVAEWMYQQRRDSGRTPPTLEELLAQ